MRNSAGLINVNSRFSSSNMKMNWPRGGNFVITPRGNRIYLRKDTWNHIKNFHPELKDSIMEILDTIREPEAIHQGIERNSFRSYRRSELIGSFIMVIYQVTHGSGRVKTAYLVHNPYAELRRLQRIWI